MRSWPLLGLIALTQLDGSTVWVEATQVQIIRVKARECGPGTGSVVKVLTTALCVKEGAEQVREKIKANGNKGER